MATLAASCILPPPPTDQHCTYYGVYVLPTRPLPPLLASSTHFSRAVFLICSFNMQSTNCTAHIAPEVGMSVLVNTLFPLLPCCCVSPHCKTGAAQSIFPAAVRSSRNPREREASRSSIPSISLPPCLLAYICLQVTLVFRVPEGFCLFTTGFLFIFIFVARGPTGLYNGLVIKFGLLSTTLVNYSPVLLGCCGRRLFLWCSMPSLSAQVARCTPTTFPPQKRKRPRGPCSKSPAWLVTRGRLSETAPNKPLTPPLSHINAFETPRNPAAVGVFSSSTLVRPQRHFSRCVTFGFRGVWIRARRSSCAVTGLSSRWNPGQKSYRQSRHSDPSPPASGS